MKKILACLLAVGMALCLLTACGKAADSTSATSGQAVEQGYKVNPLTGEAFAEGQSAETRPVAVLFSMAQGAQPQSGIAAANVLVETVGDGNRNSQIMALYPSVQALGESVGPVATLTDAFVQMALPINAVLVHTGSSLYAANLLNSVSYQDIDGQMLGKTVFAYDGARAQSTPHEYCWYTSSDLVRAGLSTVGLAENGGSELLFKFGSAPAGGTDAPNVTLQYAEGATASFTYDAGSGLYMKGAFGAPHTDVRSGEQLSFKNVFLLYTTAQPKAGDICMDIGLSSGKGLYITGGKAHDISWKKAGENAPLLIVDGLGMQISVAAGKSYIGFVPQEQQPNVQLASEAVIAAKEGWVDEESGHHYYQNNVLATGIQMIDGLWYNLDGAGNMQTGWADYNGGRMYFIEGGGVMTGVQNIDGTEYTFAEDGMLQQ